MTDKPYRESLRSRFTGREELDRDALFADHLATLGVGRTDVESLLDMIELEFDLPVGLLRARDELGTIFAPVQSGNPLRWVEYQTRAADAKAELSQCLAQRLGRFGTTTVWSEIRTFGELVRAWGGLGAS